MSAKKIVVGAADTPLDHQLETARNAIVVANVKTGEVIVTYARLMESKFNLRDNAGKVTSIWFELKGKLKAGVKAERALFEKAFTDAGTAAGKDAKKIEGLINVNWQRVKEESGYLTAGNKAKAAAGIDGKTLAELKTILNRIFKGEEDADPTGEQSSEVKGLLLEAFETLGGDIDSIG